MHFNALIFFFALIAIVHGAAIGIRAPPPQPPSYAQRAKAGSGSGRTGTSSRTGVSAPARQSANPTPVQRQPVQSNASAQAPPARSSSPSAASAAPSTAPSQAPTFYACDCPVFETNSRKTFTEVEVSRAHLAAKTFRGTGYPHEFGNKEGIDMSECRGETLLEYPLLPSPAMYGRPGDTRAPGAHRIVFGKDSGKFCGCMSHKAKPSNDFVKCNRAS